MTGNMCLAAQVVPGFVAKCYVGSPGVFLAFAVDGRRVMNFASKVTPMFSFLVSGWHISSGVQRTGRRPPEDTAPSLLPSDMPR